MSHSYYLSSLQDVTHRVRRLTFKARQSDDVLNFDAGQYAYLTFADFDKRPFSIANIPDHDPEILEFFITRADAGPARYATHDISVGEVVKVEGPFGDMRMCEQHDRPVVAISGGTGFVPIYALILQMLKHNCERQIHLFQGERTHDDIFYHDLISDLKNTYSNFRCDIALSEQNQHDSGYLQGDLDHVINEYVSDLSTTSVFLAGPPPMISAVIPYLISKQMPGSNLHTDKANLSEPDLERLQKAS